MKASSTTLPHRGIIDRAQRVTSEDQIKELEAQIAAFKYAGPKTRARFDRIIFARRASFQPVAPAPETKKTSKPRAKKTTTTLA